MLISSVLFVLIILGGWALLVPNLQAYATRFGVQPGVSGTVATVVYGATLWFLAGMLFLTLATTASAFMWESLSYQVEEKVYGYAPRQTLTMSTIMFDSSLRMAHAFTLICCMSVAAFIFWPINILIAGWMGMHDFTAPALMRRGILFHRQTPRIWGAKGLLGFALTVGIFGILPFVNLFLLPAFVAGGTMLLAEHEGKTPLTSP
jgi:uncharacterized protein involved in cysteine biosynthesis